MVYGSLSGLGLELKNLFFIQMSYHLLSVSEGLYLVDR